jgi:endonuclease/exonuclease/phosphatase family metal-dependent hydrolase
VTGDFNCLDSDTAYALITHGWTGVPGLRDTRRMALYPAYGSSYTFNGFKTEIHPGERIDYIFVHRIRDVFRHGVLSDRWDGRFVSDHHAVIAEMVLPD